MKKFTIIATILILVLGITFLSAEKPKERIANELAYTADSLFAAKQFGEALKTYEQSLATFKEAVTEDNLLVDEMKQVTYKLYASSVNAKAYESAIKWGTEVLKTDSLNYKIIKNLSTIYFKNLKDINNAVAIMAKWDAKTPGYENRLIIAEYYEQNNDLTNALDWYNKALALKTDAKVLGKVANFYIKTNQPAQAIKTYEDYIATMPGDEEVFSTYKQLGALSELKLKNPKKAIEYYEKALKIKFDKNMMLKVMNKAYEATNYPKTIDCASKIIEQDTKVASAYYFRALSYYKLKKNKEALADFEKITKDADYGKNAQDYIKSIKSGN